MKTVEEIKAVLRAEQGELHRRFHVRRIGIFGSHARGQATPVSDVDILVDLDQPVGWEIVDLHCHLETILEAKVDLVTQRAVMRKPLLWRSIEENLVYV